MRKTYIAPKMEMTKIELANMIADSGAKVLQGSLDPDAAESRSFIDGFDDEEDDGF